MLHKNRRLLRHVNWLIDMAKPFSEACGVLEGDSQAEPDRATTIYAFLSKRIDQPAKVWIGRHVVDHRLQGSRIYGNIEVTE